MKTKMENTMTIEQIDKEIEELRKAADQVKGRQTEVYTRIVGYYRSVKNWNRGKREEYKHRLTFDISEENREKTGSLKEMEEIRRMDSASPQSKAGKNLNRIASYQYFYRTTCPNCPPVKAYLAELGYPGSEINVDMDTGFELAGELAVCATPTVIFRDSEGNEILRSVNLQELIKTFSAERAVS